MVAASERNKTFLDLIHHEPKLTDEYVMWYTAGATTCSVSPFAAAMSRYVGFTAIQTSAARPLPPLHGN